MRHEILLALPDFDIEEITEEETRLEPPWNVFIHNDDVTPMDFVVHVLTGIFELDVQTAVDVMLRAHTSGVAYVCTLPKSEAEKRVGKAHFAAALEGYPLTFTLEPDE